MADMEKDLGTVILEQNPFTPAMRLPPHWQTDEAVVTSSDVADLQDPTYAVSKVLQIKYAFEGQAEQKTYSPYIAYGSGE
jgi:hypothetical protein